MGALSFFSFDFLSLDCLFEKSDHTTSVYLWSAAPICVALILIVVHCGRSRSSTTSALTYRLLLLGYLVLPPVSLKQLQALDCVTVADKRYLRTDTSIDCDSSEFQTFKAIDGSFIALYLATPLVWFGLLYLKRDWLNPSQTSGLDTKHGLFLRDTTLELEPLRFLFGIYKMDYWYQECIEMYRRILFVGVLPLLSSDSSTKAFVGVFLATFSLIYYRELEPFLKANTNLCAATAQYCVLVTFGAALAIQNDVVEGIDPLLFGCIMVAVNLVIIGLVLAAGYQRHLAERKRRHEQKARQAQKVEWACSFDATKFQTTLDAAEQAHIPPTSSLVYWYGSNQEVEEGLQTGIPASASVLGRTVPGVVFTLHRPYELDDSDVAAFPNQECCAVRYRRICSHGSLASARRRK